MLTHLGNGKPIQRRAERRHRDRHYPLMTISDIGNLPIGNIAEGNCVLFMWVQDAHLENALTIGRKWGFQYKTIAFVWDKQNFGMGYWTRKGAEICLLFTKGYPQRLSASVRQFISEKTGKHSHKPNVIREKIVELMGNLSRIELFARQRVDGWDAWGNEIESDVDF